MEGKNTFKKIELSSFKNNSFKNNYLDWQIFRMNKTMLSKLFKKMLFYHREIIKTKIHHFNYKLMLDVFGF